jgi:hypothetical protein
MNKKIKLTESQFERLKPTLMEVSENKYFRNVKIWFTINGQIFPDKEISEISSDAMKISYLIDLNYKSWGINGVNIYGFTGPKTINVNVEYYVNEAGDTDVMVVPLVIDWSKVSINEKKGEGIIGIGDEIDMGVELGEGGTLKSGGLRIDVHTI